MTKHFQSTILFLLVLLIAAAIPTTSSFADGSKTSEANASDKTDDSEDAAEEAAEEATEEATEEPLEFEGIFEATNSTAYSLQPKEWSEFIVREAVPHGAKVRKGQVLIQFETEALDEKIEDLVRQRRVDELALKQAVEDLALLQKSMPMELEKARREEKLAVEDLTNFLKQERPQKIKDLAFGVEQTAHYLDYEREELDQLERMYKADDLTEETEEIILTRARHSVKAAEYSLQNAKLSQQKQFNIELPRRELELQQAVRDNALSLEKRTILQPIELNEAKLNLVQQQVDFEKQATALAKLQADRKLLTLVAAHEGYVYYGGSTFGQWPEIDQMRKSLRPGGSAPEKQTLLTVLAERPMFVRARFSEEHLHAVQKGMKVTVQPTGFPEMELAARVAEISPVPVSEGKFEAIVEVKFPGGESRLVPGMGVSIKFPSEQVKD